MSVLLSGNGAQHQLHFVVIRAATNVITDYSASYSLDSVRCFV